MESERTRTPWMSTPSMSAVADGPVWKQSINERCEIGRIEQRDQVLREIDESVDAPLRLAEQHRTGSATQGKRHDGEIELIERFADEVVYPR